ncbi:MAG: winged helix-turn-helix transcriptional regulator [Candidatus Thorarchaeota archaeon]|nr:winged helix-turn-helix transcriptional regulator [Candidatus Thorarchaeota archaeon]
MPEGLAVMKWDDELGPVVASKTPKGLKLGLDPTTSMRVYGIATLGETEDSQKPGFNTLAFNDFKLAVYYGGLNMHLKGLPSMVFLVLNLDEDPDLYKDALPEIATQIFLNADDNKFKEMVPKLYKQIARYTQMSAEQRQASVLNDPVRRTILQTLMKRGTLQSADLEQIILDEVGKKIDVDLILRPLVNMGIIATGWVEGLSSEVVYLTRALFILRKVSLDTVHAFRDSKFPPEVSEQFMESSRKYHHEYVTNFHTSLFETIWTEVDSLVKYILDFNTYDILQVLRKGPLGIKELKAEVKLTESKLRAHLEILQDADIVMQISDEEGHEYAILKCDPEVVTVYPEWLIQKTVELYNDEEIASRQAIHYLEVLKKSHPSLATSIALEVE